MASTKMPMTRALPWKIAIRRFVALGRAARGTLPGSAEAGGMPVVTRHPKPTVHVVGRARVLGLLKSWAVGPLSTMPPGVALLGEEERRLLRDPSGLLHVVGDDDDRHVASAARRSSPRSGASRSGRGPSRARP